MGPYLPFHQTTSTQSWKRISFLVRRQRLQSSNERSGWIRQRANGWIRHLSKAVSACRHRPRWIWQRARRQCLHAVIAPVWKTACYFLCSTGARCQSLLRTRRLSPAPRSCDTASTSVPRARLLPRPQRPRTEVFVGVEGARGPRAA